MACFSSPVSVFYVSYVFYFFNTFGFLFIYFFFNKRFWKKCCQAFTNQLIEQGHILQAATYLIALHNIKQVINILMEKQFFKEALIIAKIHCQPDDPITSEITEKWIRYFESVGNLNSAAYM